MVKLSLSRDESNRCSEHRLKWMQMSCANTVENAVTVVNMA